MNFPDVILLFLKLLGYSQEMADFQRTQFLSQDLLSMDPAGGYRLLSVNRHRPILSLSHRTDRRTPFKYASSVTSRHPWEREGSGWTFKKC